MEHLDINQDGKISFDQFKFWWLKGHKGKLGDLVFLQARAMKMTKQFMKQFQKAGVDLNQMGPDSSINTI